MEAQAGSRDAADWDPFAASQPEVPLPDGRLLPYFSATPQFPRLLKEGIGVALGLNTRLKHPCLHAWQTSWQNGFLSSFLPWDPSLNSATELPFLQLEPVCLCASSSSDLLRIRDSINLNCILFLVTWFLPLVQIA